MEISLPEKSYYLSKGEKPSRIAYFISSVAQSTNPYNTCVADCKKVNQDKYLEKWYCPGNTWKLDCSQFKQDLSGYNQSIIKEKYYQNKGCNSVFFDRLGQREVTS